MGRTLSWLLRPNLLKALIFDIRLAWRLLREPHVPLEAARMSATKMIFSDNRARTEIGYTSRPAREAIGAFPRGSFTFSDRCSAQPAEFGERAAVQEPENSAYHALESDSNLKPNEQVVG